MSTPLVHSCFITVRVKQLLISALVDSGSHYNLASSALIRKLRLQVIPFTKNDECTKLFGASGAPLHLAGKCDFILDIDSLKLPISVLVCSNLSEDLLIGRSFLTDSCAQLNFVDKTITFSDSIQVNMHDKLNKQILIRSAAKIVIPAGSEMTIKVKCDSFYKNKDVVIKPNPQSQFVKYAVGSAIVHFDENNISFCRILNFQNRTITICPDEVLGLIENFDKKHCFLIDTQKVKTAHDPISESKLLEFNDKMKFNINPALPHETKIKLLTILYNRREAFVTPDSPLGYYKGGEVDIELKENFKPAYKKPFPHKFEHRKIIQEQIEKWKSENVIEPSSEYAWSAPIFLIAKPSLQQFLNQTKDSPHGKCDKPSSEHFRLLVDLRSCNAQLKEHIIFTPPCRQLIDEVAGFSENGTRASYFSQLDMTGAFTQIGVAPSSRNILTFRDTYGESYRFRRLPFGLQVSPAKFIGVVSKLFGRLRDTLNLTYYYDDFLLHDSDAETQLNSLDQVLSIFEASGLRCGIKKSNFLMPEVTFLGAHISAAGISLPDASQRTLNMLADKPMRSRKNVQQLLGLINFWRLHIPGLCERSKHLRNLTLVDQPFVFDDKCRAEQIDLINALRNAVALQPLNRFKRCYLLIDSSTVGCGIVVCQSSEDVDDDDKFTKRELAYINKNQSSNLRPVFFLSYASGKAQKHFSSCDIELAGLQRCLIFLQTLGIRNEFTIFSDNLSCVAFNNLNLGSNRLRRIIAYLMRFRFKVVYLPGKNHKCADYLSRCLDHLPEGELLKWNYNDEEILNLDDCVFSINNPSVTDPPPSGENGKWVKYSLSNQPIKGAEFNRPIACETLSCVVNTHGDEQSAVADAIVHSDDVLTDEPLPVDTAANMLDLSLSTVVGADYENDPIFGDIYNYLKYGTLSGDKERDFKTMLVESLYIVENDRLYRVSLPRNKRRTADTSPLVVLPLKWCNDFITSLHRNNGHPSTRRLH